MNHIRILYCITAFLSFGWFCEYQYFRYSVDRILSEEREVIWNNIWSDQGDIQKLEGDVWNLQKKFKCLDQERYCEQDK